MLYISSSMLTTADLYSSLTSLTAKWKGLRYVERKTSLPEVK